jgi:hypothetical protein
MCYDAQADASERRSVSITRGPFGLVDSSSAKNFEMIFPALAHS